MEQKSRATKIRCNIKRMIANGGGGHAGGSLSMVEILTVLFSGIMRYDPKNPKFEGRDRFILSKGHSALGLYAVLAEVGYFPESMMDTFATKEGPLMNHPDAHHIPGVEVSTGSLGHGFSIATGIALAGKIKKSNYKTFCVLGDGECHEGMVWEAAMSASSYGLENLIAIVDRNKVGNDGLIDYVNLNPLAEKWRSFGWKVVEVDGHDMEQLSAALENCIKNKGPWVVIANTVKGKGLIESIEGTGKAHYIKATKDNIEEYFQSN